MKKIMILVAVALLITLSACQNVGQATQEEPIKIGAILMLTGPGASWGISSQRGMQLAIDELNEGGGINGRKLVASYEDDQGSAVKAVSAYRKLVDIEKIQLLVGTTWSPSGLAVSPLTQEKQTVMISPTLGVADFNEDSDFAFNLWPHDDLLSERLGQHIYDEGFRKIAVLGTLQVWEQEQAHAVKKGFEDAGGQVVSFELADMHDKELLTEVLKISESDAEAVVFTNYETEDISALRLREMGSTIPFYSVLLENDKMASAKDALEGTIVVSSFTPDEVYVEKYRSAFNEDPDIGADTSYDVIMLLAQAMEATGTDDPIAVQQYLAGLEVYEGVSGTLVFDGKGGVTKNPKFFVVRDGTKVPLT